MKQIHEPVILSTAYFPNIQYISKFLLHTKVIVDIHETYPKQSYRNRCRIYGANGALNLSIPVIKPSGNETITKDIQIEYDTNWQKNHWRAIISAYGHSPFYEIFEEELHHLFHTKEKYLIDFNYKALMQVFYSLGVEFRIEYSKEYIKHDSINYDYRDIIHPKSRMQKPDRHYNFQTYFQVFSDKHGFIPNLSFLDLIFNEGPQALEICRECCTLKTSL